MTPYQHLESLKPRGIIHVGANDGEEFAYYQSLGVKNLIGFEPLKKPFREFSKQYPEVIKYQLGWGKVSGKYGINITENDKASSILKTVPTDDWTTHPVFKDWNMGQWPVVGREIVEVINYDEWMDKNQHYEPEDYNCLVMDVQGFELEALRGAEKQLAYFDTLIVECSETPVYEGEPPASEIVSWLSNKGFYQATPIIAHGDILFRRQA